MCFFGHFMMPSECSMFTLSCSKVGCCGCGWDVVVMCWPRLVKMFLALFWELQHQLLFQHFLTCSSLCWL